MKKQFWYFRWINKMDAKYREKWGDEKFLSRVAKEYRWQLVAFIMSFLITPLGLLLGLSWILGWGVAAVFYEFFFILGIIVLSLIGILVLVIILQVILLPFYKKRSQKAQEELDLLLSNK